jgi:replicative DNA helicase
MSHDDNDAAMNGTLPEDPAAGTKTVAEAPRLRTAHDLIAGAMSRAFSREAPRAIPSGHHLIDQKTGGFKPGWCWVIGADTNVGKSTLAVAFADVALRLGKGVLIVSLEDSEDIYGDRLLLRRGRRDQYQKINADRLRTRTLTPDEMQIVTDVTNEAERKPMFLDAIGWSGQKLAKALARTLDAMPEIELVIVDYLGEIASEGRSEDRRNEVRAMASLVKSTVKSRRRCVIILSQITVDEKNPDKFPRRHQIRDSRDVINGAEVVAMLGIVQADLPDKKTGDVILRAGERGLLLDKVKQGRKGMVPLHWDDDAACFVDVEDPRHDERGDPPLGRSWSPASRPVPRPHNEAAERDDPGEGLMDDGFGGLPRN